MNKPSKEAIAEAENLIGRLPAGTLPHPSDVQWLAARIDAAADKKYAGLREAVRHFRASAQGSRGVRVSPAMGQAMEGLYNAIRALDQEGS